jgi:hypothetical protein
MGELTLKIWSFPRERIMETNKIGIDGTVEKRRIGEGRAGNDNPNENEEKEKRNEMKPLQQKQRTKDSLLELKLGRIAPIVV